MPKIKARFELRGLLLASVAALSITGTAAHAQSYQFASFDVQGNQRIEDSTVVNYMGIRPGQRVSAARVNAGLKRLQEVGLFERVEVVPSGNTLVVIVQEFPTINRISFEGNQRIKDENIAPVLTSAERRVFNPVTAEADANNIIRAYEAAGRLAAQVTPRIIRRADNRVDLVFEIIEGAVTEIERISFVGNRAYSDRRLRRIVESKQAGIFRALIGNDTFIGDRIGFDEQLLRDFYASRGYIDARVLSTAAELSPNRDAYFLTFRVQEGQQFTFNEITAVSNLDEVDAELYQEEIKVKAGDVYSPAAVDRMVERLELLATQEGLNFVRVVPRVIRNDEDLTLDIELMIERGPRLFVERIDIEGNATTLDRVVRRQFDTVEGDPFNPRAIRASADRIRRLGYFANAEVNARPGSNEDQIVVDVDVEEKPTGSLGFSFSVSQQNGAGIGLSFSENNFLGRGQRVTFNVDTTSTNNNSRISFTEPFFLNRDLAMNLAVGYQTTDEEDTTFNTEQISFTAGLNFPTGEYSRLGVYYSALQDELTPNDPTNTSQILKDEAAKAVTSSIGYNWSYDTRNTGLDLTRGVFLSFGQEVAGFGGDREFVKTRFKAIGERTAFAEEVKLIAAFEAGNITSFGDDSTRFQNRFFVNQRQLRGFEARGIGPRDLNAGNDPLGGNNYFAARLESQFPLNFLPAEYGMRGAMFMDAGSVWGLDNTGGGASGTDPVNDGFNLRSAVGFALLWDTQIGPLRFNFTRALSSEDYDNVQNFDFTIQTQF